MHGILTIAHLTFHEAWRRKVLLFAFLLGLGFLVVFGLGFYFIAGETAANPKVTPQERGLILNFIILAGLYAANFLTVMTAVLTPVDTLSGEIASGAIQSLATKPMRRSAIVLGKWLGFWCILCVYVVFIAGGVLAVARAISGYTPPGVAIGVPLMALEGTLLMTISIAGGARLSTLANGMMAFGLYGMAFVAGWVEQAGTLFGNATSRNVGIVTSLLIPSESLWQLAAYNMQPPLMRGVNLTPFSPASVPSGMMVAWAAVYLVVVLGIAVRQFGKRNL